MVTISFWFLLQLTPQGGGYDADVLGKFHARKECQMAMARAAQSMNGVACVHVQVKQH